MQFSTRGRYAIMAMLDMAHMQKERGEEAPVKLEDIAGRQNISLSYLEQLFAQLRKADLVKSIRGPGGGYVLARPTYDTWLGDVMQAVNENTDVTRCPAGSEQGCMEKGGRCNSHYLWAALGDCIGNFFNQISLEMAVQNDFGDFTPMEVYEKKGKKYDVRLSR